MINNEMTIEELEKEYEKVTKRRENLSKVLNERKRAIEEEKKAKLAAAKEEREKEIVEAYKKFEDLLIKYNNDYGVFKFNFNDDKLPSLLSYLLNW